MTAFVWPHPSAAPPTIAIWHWRTTGAWERPQISVRAFATESEAAGFASILPAGDVDCIEFKDGTVRSIDGWPPYEAAVTERREWLRRRASQPERAPTQTVTSPTGHVAKLDVLLNPVPTWVGKPKRSRKSKEATG